MESAAAPPVLAAGLDQMMQLIVFAVAVLGGFYFILLRPVLNQQRAQRRELAHLQVGDEVLLTSGFIARVEDMQFREDGTALLTLDIGGVKVRALPSAIARRWSEHEAPTATEPSDTAEPGQPGAAVPRS